MRAVRPFALTLLVLSALFAFSVAARADRIGAPYRGPGELLVGGAGRDESPNDPPDDGSGRGRTTFIPRALWQWWWENNKERFLADAILPGRAHANGAYYWFGAGAKYPERVLRPVTPDQRGQIFRALDQAMEPSAPPAVRAEAAIALGRLGTVPIAEQGRKAGIPGDPVVRRLIRAVKTDRDAGVRHSATLALGMTGHPDGTAFLRRAAGSAAARDRATIALALGIAGDSDALPILAGRVPRRAGGTVTGASLGAIAAIGLLGPGALHDHPEIGEPLVDRLARLAGSRRAKAGLLMQSIATLGRLQRHLPIVRRALRHKNLNVRWTAVQTLANYADEPAAAEAAARALVGREGIQANHTRTRTFALLAAGELARHVDRNGEARRILLEALREALDRNDPYIDGAAAVAVGIAGDRSAAPALAQHLDESSNDTVMAGACLGLGLLKATQYEDLIVHRALQTTKVKPDTRGYAALGLALMGDTTQVATILRYQSGSGLSSAMLRQMPLALGALGDHNHVEALTRHFETRFKTEERHQASNAAFAFTLLRDEAALPRLLRLSRNPEPRVRGLAVVALGYLAARDRVSPLARTYENVSFWREFDWELLHTIHGIL